MKGIQSVLQNHLGTSENKKMKSLEVYIKDKKINNISFNKERSININNESV